MATGARVLVVEDDDSMRTALLRLLSAAGYDGVGYGSAEELLVGNDDLDAACLVCDQNLPKISGLDLLAELRSQQQSIPLILITAFHKPGLQERAIRSGAAAFLTKPFEGAVLLKAISEAIRFAKDYDDQE